MSALILLLIGLLILLHGTGPGWNRRRAPLAWGLGNVAHAAGMLLTVAPGYRTSDAMLILANLLVMASMTLLWYGTAQFMSARRHLWLYLLPLVTIAGTFPIFVYLAPSQLVRIIIVSALGVLGCCDSGRLLMSGKTLAVKALGAGLFGIGLLSGLRGLVAGAALFRPDPFAHLARADLTSPALLVVFTTWSVAMLAAHADRSERELITLVEQFRTASLTDQLTHLANRRQMEIWLEEATMRLQQRGEIFSVLIIDTDHFKQVNDRFGHHGGDYVLRKIAQALQGIVSNPDAVARWGGEEFVALVPGCDSASAHRKADQMRAKLSELSLRMDSEPLSVTVTVGGATATAGEALSDLIRRADHALYLGKQRGKNIVVWA